MYVLRDRGHGKGHLVRRWWLWRHMEAADEAGIHFRHLPHKRPAVLATRVSLIDTLSPAIRAAWIISQTRIFQQGVDD